MVEDPDRQRAFKKVAKQLKGKDPSAKLDAIAACSDHSFLIEVKIFLMYLKESSHSIHKTVNTNIPGWMSTVIN